MKRLLCTGFTCLLLLMSLMHLMAQTPASVLGQVVGYLSNRIGDYDGLQLQTATGEVHLFFPPHTAARIRQLAPIRQWILAEVEPGRSGPRPGRPGLDKRLKKDGQPEPITYRLIRLREKKSGSVWQLSDWPPPPPQSGHLIQSEGPIISTLQDEKGQLAALLTDKYLIELKPHQAEQISYLLLGVQRLGVTGFERMNDGFVNRTGRPVLHPTTLTIRGQTFAL